MAIFKYTAVKAHNRRGNYMEWTFVAVFRYESRELQIQDIV